MFCRSVIEFKFLELKNSAYQTDLFRPNNLIFGILKRRIVDRLFACRYENQLSLTIVKLEGKKILLDPPEGFAI